MNRRNQSRNKPQKGAGLCDAFAARDLGSRPWTTTLRVEQHCGTTRYVVEFTNGQLRASLCGSLASFSQQRARRRAA
jgi:hypothetical protein